MEAIVLSMKPSLAFFAGSETLPAFEASSPIDRLPPADAEGSNEEVTVREEGEGAVPRACTGCGSEGARVGGVVPVVEECGEGSAARNAGEGDSSLPVSGPCPSPRLVPDLELIPPRWPSHVQDTATTRESLRQAAPPGRGRREWWGGGGASIRSRYRWLKAETLRASKEEGGGVGCGSWRVETLCLREEGSRGER